MSCGKILHLLIVLFVLSTDEISRVYCRSGWCSGYHARFTRERSRVRTSHPIFFCILFYCYSRFLSFQKMGVVSTHNENHKSSLVIVSSPQFGRTFSAVWLRSSVVSVLFSVKTENVPTGYIFFTCIFRLGRL